MASPSTQQDRDKLKGIVLRTDGDFTIYVWSPKYPMNELRFIDEEQHHSPGDFICFKLTAPIDHIQTYDSIIKTKTPRTLKVVYRDPAPINIIVQIGFPPRDSNYFDRDIAETLDYGVVFYCYCPEFGKLVSFDSLNFEPGHFYTAHIERISLQNDWSIKKLGTMFVLVDHPLIMIDDDDEIRRLSSQMPWKRFAPPQLYKEETSYGATVRALLENSQHSNDQIKKLKEFCPRSCDIYEGRVKPFIASKTAVLVVDVQNWTTEKGRNDLPLTDYFYEETTKNVIPNIKRILDCAREYGIEVVFTVVENYTKDGRDRSLDYKISNFFVPKGSHHAQVIKEFERREDEMIIPKTSSSLFNSTNFEYLMRNIGIDTIIVTGFITDQCVANTICSGADRGFWMICPSDACGTCSHERHVNALNAFKGYCRIESTEEIIAAIQNDIKTRI